jgi:Ca2+-binding RTX toxin-like protein
MPFISGTFGNDTIMPDGISPGVSGGLPGVGDDYIYGYGGDDSLSGGNGTDEFYGGANNDTILGGEGYAQQLRVRRMMIA